MSTDPAETVHLNPTEIWYLYKTKILIYGGIILAAVILFSGVQLRTYLRTSGSQALYEQADTAADYAAIIQKYPGTPAAGNAALREAEKLRADGKYDEAAQVLRQFVDKYPAHPLACGGWTSLGVTYEKQGKLDDALDAYANAISKYPDAYTTPIAMMAQARIYLLKDKKEDARRIYMDVAARYGQSIYGQEAARDLHFIKK